MATVSLGADERTALTDALLAELGQRGHELTLHGALAGSGEEWARVGELVARDVVSGRTATGIACCHTGTGVCIAANKVTGARAALCADAGIAIGARRWNDANVLCLSLARTRPGDLPAILDAWFDGGPVDEAERANLAHVGLLERLR
ncbi:RpiB/LacA/LacB family sugar-phosphate isomerase [bacterium]|nr:MAG: RpiB/LacA/LacB family sugar-phosphate isomerase [bacterium]MCL4231783.1 RpiB/LacA/LacB family sugar-phosphate isomerase [Dehalococcoidia bacterium]